MTLAKRFFLMIVALVAVCATAAADAPSGREPRFRKVFAFTNIGADPSAHAAQFDAAEPIWITAEKGEINSSVIFASALAILLQADFDFYFSAKD